MIFVVIRERRSILGTVHRTIHTGCGFVHFVLRESWRLNAGSYSPYRASRDRINNAALVLDLDWNLRVIEWYFFVQFTISFLNMRSWVVHLSRIGRCCCICGIQALGEAVLVHCTAVKDRTGCLRHLVLELGGGYAGVAGQYALEDWGLREERRGRWRVGWGRRRWGGLGGRGWRGWWRWWGRVWLGCWG